jgi:hypothetical protein
VNDFDLEDQRLLLAATDIQVHDSNERTEAAGFTEADIAVCAGLELAPPWNEGILQAQGIRINLDVPGEGNTLIPENGRPESYLEILNKVLAKTPEELAEYQATSVRLSRIVEARLTAAEYLRQFNQTVVKEEATRASASGRAQEFIVGMPKGASEDMVAAIRSVMGAGATIVSAKSEEELKMLARERNQTAILIDESVTPAMIREGKLQEVINLIGFEENRGLILSLNEFNISDKTREELVRILDILKRNLDTMKRVDIDTALRRTLAQEIPGLVSQAQALVAKRKDEIAAVYNSVGIDEAVSYGGEVAIATTERIAESDPFTFDNMEKASEHGVRNCFIYGDILKSVDEAQAFVRACGYRGDMRDIAFIDKRGLSYEGLVAEIARQTGVKPQNIGIRAAEAEVLKQDEKPASGRLLEVQAITINGQQVYAAMNTYQILLKLLTQLKEGIALDGINIPGVSYDAAKGVFRYLPRAIPIDYGKEIETYRRAITLIRSAA